MSLSLIAAIGKKNELGKSNTLLWDLPIDMKHFREMTAGKTVIMGQKTFESIGKPLPNRRNIILTRDPEFRVPDAEMAYSPLEVFGMIDSEEENFIIGGGQVYALFIEKADKLYITHVDAEFPDADTFFPAIDPNTWKIISEEPHKKDAEHAYDFVFKTYKKT